MATEVGSIFVKLGLDTSGLQQGIDDATSKVRNMGQKIASVGRNLTLGLSAPIAAAGGAAVKAAGDFEQSFSRIEGLVGVSEDQVNAFKSEVLALSGEVAQSPRELAQAMFQITSAGLEGEQALNALESSAKAAAAGLGETRTVADAATSAMNAYGQENLSAAEATDVLTASVREGKVQPEQLSASLGKVIPTAAAAGVEFEQVGAAIAAMTRQGANARRATTALNSLLAQVQDPSSQAEKALKRMGLSADQLRSVISDEGLLPALQQLKDAAGGNTQEMAALFGNVRAMRAAMQLAGESADKTREIFDELADATGSTDAAFKEAKETFNFRFRQFRTAVDRLQISIGNELLPAVTDLVEGAREMVSQFQAMDEEARRNAKAFTALAIAIPPALFVGGKLMVGLSALASTAIPAVGTALAALATPIGATVAAIAGIAGLAGIIETNFLGLRDSMAQIFVAMSNLSRKAGEVIELAFQVAFDSVIEDLQGLLGNITQTLASIPGADQFAFLSFMTQGLLSVETRTQQTASELQSAWSDLGSAASGVGTAVTQSASRTADQVSQMLRQTRDEFLETIGLLRSGSAAGGGQGQQGGGQQERGAQPAPMQSMGGGGIGGLIPDRIAVGFQRASQAARRFQEVSNAAMRAARAGVLQLNRGLSRAVTEAEGIGDAFQRMGQQVLSVLENIIARLTVAAALSAAISALSLGGPLGLGSGFGSIFGNLAGLDSGGLIRSDGIAKVHKGEAVVTREMMQGRRRSDVNLALETGQSELVGGQIVTPVSVVRDANEQAEQQLSQKGRALE